MARQLEETISKRGHVHHFMETVFSYGCGPFQQDNAKSAITCNSLWGVTRPSWWKYKTQNETLLDWPSGWIHGCIPCATTPSAEKLNRCFECVNEMIGPSLIHGWDVLEWAKLNRKEANKCSAYVTIPRLKLLEHHFASLIRMKECQQRPQLLPKQQVQEIVRQRCTNIEPASLNKHRQTICGLICELSPDRKHVSRAAEGF